MKPREIVTTHNKALRINLDDGKYGTFSEVGAGQEAGRCFFRVGGAAGSVANTISAYDIQTADPAWERLVPAPVVEMLKEHGYFRG